MIDTSNSINNLGKQYRNRGRRESFNAYLSSEDEDDYDDYGNEDMMSYTDANVDGDPDDVLSFMSDSRLIREGQESQHD